MIKVEELKCVLGKMLSGAQSSFESMSHAHAAALTQAEAADKAKTARLLHAASQLEGLQGHLAKADAKQAESEAALEEQKAAPHQPKPNHNNNAYSFILLFNTNPI